MTPAHELLKEILANWDDPHSDPIRTDGLMERIREYIADTNPSETISNQEVDKPKRETLSEGSIFNEWNVRLHQFEISNLYNAFLHGVRFAERHHGIGGEG